MAGISQQSLDPNRTIVVLNFPFNVGEDDLTIHFQKARYGGGDVDDVLVDGNVAFVTFDLPTVAKSVLKHEQIIDKKNVQIQSYESWLAKRKSNAAVDNQDDDSGNATIYVSGLGSSTTDESITHFFESKKRTGGGDLCKGKKGIERVAPTVARLTFVSSKDAQNVLQKSKEEPLKLGGNLLTVSTAFESIYDKSILLAKNLNPQTDIETFTSFVQFKRNVDVCNVVLGKEGKAIVILNDEADLNEECVNENMELDGSVISLEFAPLTNHMRVSNIPEGTSKDDVMYKFQSRIPGDQVTNVELDEKKRIADVYLENCSVVSELVKKEHKLRSVKLIVYPYHDDFEEEVKTKTAESTFNCQLDSRVMDYILRHGEIDMFSFKSMKYDKVNSRIYYTKDFDNSIRAKEFEEKVSGFLGMFNVEEVKIPTVIFEKVQGAIQDKCEGFNVKKIDCCFEDHRVTFVGKKEDVSWIKQTAEEIIDKVSEEAKYESVELRIDDQNKLKFLNFFDYFSKLTKEFPEMRILGMDSTSGKLTVLVTAENTKDVELRIYKDVLNLSEIDVSLSDHQLEFLRRTDCQLVNDLLKNDDVMLTLVNSKNNLQAKILSLKRFHDNEIERLLKVVRAKTTEKSIKVDDETAKFLRKSEKLQKFKKEQFDKHQVLIEQEVTCPWKFWIVCEQSKINNVENDLMILIKEKKIGISKFTPTDPMKIRFFEEHCWDKIKEKECNCKVEGIVIRKIESASLEVKGTDAGRKEVITFLETLAGKVELKVFPLEEPGMKKQASTDATKAMISLIEKKHKCVIKTEDIQREKIHEKSVKVATNITHGAVAKETVAPTNSPTMHVVNDKEIKMSSGQRITIIVGNLAMQKVDVIVNTTNDSVDLNANACGKALLKVAGDELLKECKKIGSLKAGDMASTGPGNLNCKRVYHVRSSSWDSGKGSLILRKLIRKCLDQLEKDRFTSIAIPAIGTGNLHFPRSEVANVFFEEVGDYLIGQPQSPINDIRFVAYSGDQQTVDAFLGAVQNIKSPPSTIYKSNAKNPSLTEKPDGSLELFIGSKRLKVQIVRADITKERTNVIMHVIAQDFSFKGGVINALTKAGGDDIVRACKALGKPAIFSTHYTTAGKLAADQIAHVIAPSPCKVPDLKKCLDVFLDDIQKKNIAEVSFSAIGAGAMGFPERDVVDIIFGNLLRVAELQNSKLNLVRIVIMDKEKFGKFKDATKAYVLAAGATPSSSQPVVKSATKTPQIIHGKTITIYSDEGENIVRAWGELESKMSQNIENMTMNDA